MPQSCLLGLSYMTVANYACCAANGACVYFTTCVAGTVYGPVTAVDWWVTLFHVCRGCLCSCELMTQGESGAVFGGHCYTMYIVAEGGAQVATVYDCHTALNSATLYRNTADARKSTASLSESSASSN